MKDISQGSEKKNSAEIESVSRSSLVHGQFSNPAVKRLQQRVLKEANPSEIITSYDRMHHRHSRS